MDAGFSFGPLELLRYFLYFLSAHCFLVKIGSVYSTFREMEAGITQSAARTQRASLTRMTLRFWPEAGMFDS